MQLSKCATDISDGDHAPPPKSPTGVPFITISNVDKESRRIDFSDTFTVSREYFEALKAHRKPKRGDVLYTVTGSFGIPVLVEDDGEFCFQRHIGLIRPKPDVDSRWLTYALLSPRNLNFRTTKAVPVQVVEIATFITLPTISGIEAAIAAGWGFITGSGFAGGIALCITITGTTWNPVATLWTTCCTCFDMVILPAIIRATLCCA